MADIKTKITSPVEDEPTEQVAKEQPVKEKGTEYFFPREGVNIKADSLEKAQEIYNNKFPKVKENKESNNG